MKRHTGWTGALGDDTDLIPERDIGQMSPKKRAVNQTRKLEDAGRNVFKLTKELIYLLHTVCGFMCSIAPTNHKDISLRVLAHLTESLSTSH